MGADAFKEARTNVCFLHQETSPVYGNECDGSDPTAARTVVLWGDSFAAHLYFGLKQEAQRRGGISLAQYTAAGCPPLFSYDSELRHDCKAANEFVARKVELIRPETVIMAGRWDLYDAVRGTNKLAASTIRATVLQLQGMGVKRVIVVGQFPLWEADVPRIRISLRKQAAGTSAASNRAFPALFPHEMDLNAMVERAIEGTGATFVSPLATLCNEQGCLLVTPNGYDSISPDPGHLTLGGSEFFVRANSSALFGD